VISLQEHHAAAHARDVVRWLSVQKAHGLISGHLEPSRAISSHLEPSRAISGQSRANLVIRWGLSKAHGLGASMAREAALSDDDLVRAMVTLPRHFLDAS